MAGTEQPDPGAVHTDHTLEQHVEASGLMLFRAMDLDSRLAAAEANIRNLGMLLQTRDYEIGLYKRRIETLERQLRDRERDLIRALTRANQIPNHPSSVTGDPD